MSQKLFEELRGVMEGDVTEDQKTRLAYARDTSLFEETPRILVFPKNAEDVSRAVRVVRTLKQSGEMVSITPRTAGTDMTGGPLTSSVLLNFMKYMNHMFEVERSADSEQQTAHSSSRSVQAEGTASCEPGCYYRDFEKATQSKGLIMPAYPASKEICAIGGMVANNCGGELTLRYGKIEKYVTALDVVLSDGSRIETKALSESELAAKKELSTFEGEIYSKLDALMIENREMIEAARPRISKNSSGYSLWNIRNPHTKTFDLSQLIVGSQGTLGIVTKATLRLVTPKTHTAMLIIFLKDLRDLPEIVHRVLRFEPQAFESYDDKTFTFAVRFFFQMLKQIGIKKMFALGIAFLPEVRMVAFGGVPKLVLMAEFAEDTLEEAEQKVKKAREGLKSLPVSTRSAHAGIQSEKYWIIRRESFNLLRKSVQGLSAASFIEDIVIPPDAYPVFLPKLTRLLDEYNMLYTIAGHIGDGNLHIFPLLNPSSTETKRLVTKLTPRVFKLVVAHGGSISGEHGDGIIRTPYVSLQFGARMNTLFKEVKDLFDPLGILNPGKKVGGTEADIARLFRKS